MRYGFGVDIYGEFTKIGCFDESGRLLKKWKFPTPMAQDGTQILPAVADEIAHYMALHQIFEDDVIGVGVGIPGPVNSSGTVNKCVNFGWGIFNISRALSGLTGLQVVSGNIATLAALGEYWKGSGSGNTVFVAMNTGLGGGIVCNGKIVNGFQGGAGEFGHIIINRNEKEACACGRKGCVEQYCSPSGILRMARRALSTSLKPSVLRKKALTDHREVVQAALNGDKLAQEVMAQFYDYAGLFLAHVCCVTNPETIVLGGEFCHMSPVVVENIAKAFRNYVFHANQNVRFEFARLGTDACLYGAFKLALDAANP